MSRFEKEVKPIESKETKQMTKLKALVEKLEKQKEINKEKLKECKYINLYKYIYYIISWYEIFLFLYYLHLVYLSLLFPLIK